MRRRWQWLVWRWTGQDDLWRIHLRLQFFLVVEVRRAATTIDSFKVPKALILAAISRIRQQPSHQKRPLIGAHQRGQTTVLVIDEAQSLKPPLFEVLRQLLNFETNSAKLLQIVLFGQNELATKLDRMPELKDRVTIFGALSSLTKADLDALVDFRWKVAGGDVHPFSEEALDDQTTGTTNTTGGRRRG